MQRSSCACMDEPAAWGKWVNVDVVFLLGMYMLLAL